MVLPKLSVGVLVILEGFVYGFGMWWVNYLYVWTIQCFITMFFKKQDSVLFFSILSGFYGITFGTLCTIPYFFVGGTSAAFAYSITSLGKFSLTISSKY